MNAGGSQGRRRRSGRRSGEPLQHIGIGGSATPDEPDDDDVEAVPDDEARGTTRDLDGEPPQEPDADRPSPRRVRARVVTDRAVPGAVTVSMHARCQTP